MKKYLNKGKFKLLIPILFIGAVFLTSHAQTKLEYYQDVFEKDFGFEVYKQDGKEKTIDNFLAGEGENKYLILLSSGLSPRRAEPNPTLRFSVFVQFSGKFFL